MRRLVLVIAALVIVFALAPRASAWTYTTHGKEALEAQDTLGDDIEVRINEDLLYQGATAPDTFATGKDIQGAGVGYDASSNSGDAVRAFDSDPSTSWVGTGGVGEWVQIDFKTEYSPNYVVLTGAYPGSTIEIQCYYSDEWHTTEDRTNVDNFVKVFYISGWSANWRFSYSYIPSGGTASFTDIWFFASLDTGHTFDYENGQVPIWLIRAKDNWDNGWYDNATFAMGMAAHYMGDCLAMVHNDNTDDGSSGERSGLTRHSQYEESVRHYAPSEPAYDSSAHDYDNSEPNYSLIWENFLLYLTDLNDALNNFAARTDPARGDRYGLWRSTRDCSMVKNDVDNATFYIYNAFCRVIGYRGGGGGGVPDSQKSSAISDVLEQRADELASLLPLALVAAAALPAVFSLVHSHNKREHSRPRRRTRARRRRLRWNERAVSPIVGAVLIISLLVIAGSMIVMNVIPASEKQSEGKHMDKVREAFQSVQTDILGGENALVDLPMTAEPVSMFFGLISGSAPEPSVLTITPTRRVMRIVAVNDAYVDNSNDTEKTRPHNDNYLWVRGSPDNAQRAFLKFDLSQLPADAEISEARLLIYIENLSRFPGSPLDPDQSPVILPPHIMLREVTDDTWDEETLTWNNSLGLPGDNIQEEDYPYSVTWELIQEDAWFSTGNISYYVEAHRGDSLASFCVVAENENSDSTRYVTFRARDNRSATPVTWLRPNEGENNSPHLLIVYTSQSLGVPSALEQRDNWGSILEGGNVKLEARNRYFQDQSIIFESGALILWQGYRTDLLADPGFLSYTKANYRDYDENIEICLNRYRITNPEEVRMEQGGDIKLRVTVENIYYLLPGDNTIYHQKPVLSAPNIDNVTITVVSSYPTIWRSTYQFVNEGVLTELSSRFMADDGTLDAELGDYSSDCHSNWGDISIRDWCSNSITIRGKDKEGVNDIYYMEKVIDVRINVEVGV